MQIATSTARPANTDVPEDEKGHPPMLDADGPTHTPEDRPPDDRLDRPAYNSRLIKIWTEYLEKHHPDVPIASIIKDAGMTLFELEDPAHWFNQKQVDRFYDLVRRDTRDPELARKVGRFLALSETIGTPRQFSLGLLDLKTIYTLMGSLSRLITRSAEVRTRSLAPNSVEIVNTVRPGFTEKAYQCENRLGTYESIGKLFGDHYAQVTHPQCIYRGDACCRYRISWQPSLWMRWRRRRNWSLLLGGLGLMVALPLLVWADWATLTVGWLAITGLTAFLSEHYKACEYAETIRTQAGVARGQINDMDLRYNNALMVQEIGQTTVTLHDEGRMIEAAARIMQKRSPYDRALIMLADRNTHHLRYAAGFGYDEDIRRQLQQTAFNLDRPGSRGVFVKAFREKKPFLIQNMDDILDALSERSRALARLVASKSMICVPIAYEEQALGIIAIDNSSSDRPLTQSDVNLLMGVAFQLAVGIVNTRAYTQLQDSEKKYRDLVENAHSIIMRIDPCGRIVFFNKFARSLFGFDRTRVEGRSAGEVLAPTTPEGGDWIFALNGHISPDDDIPLVEETAYTLGDGRKIWVAWTYRPIFSADGNLTEILCIGNDITQLKQTREENAQLEIQLERAQKMEALGTLAGGVAHDLNNVLAGLINYPELMLMRLPADSPLCRYVTAIQKSGERAAAIVQDLLTLARRNVVQMDVADMNAIVADYLGSPEFERLKAHHPAIRVTTRLETGLKGIIGSSVQLSKTVMNLVTNALEAMEGRTGEIVLTTENKYLGQPIDGYERIPPGPYVRLSVADTGCGMTHEDQRRIFEPFFTRKTMGRSGTGLGMSVVWGTIKDHGGLIDIQSKLGSGTRFDIYFPPTIREAEKTGNGQAAAYRGRGEQILVVDDLETQRDIAREILTDLGYRVVAVPGGEAALEHLAQNPADLVVLDMLMAPGIDGLETYRRIVARWPGQRAIIASGYSENEKVRQAIQLGVGQYLKKPYSMEKLGKAVHHELNRDNSRDPVNPPVM